MIRITYFKGIKFRLNIAEIKSLTQFLRLDTAYCQKGWTETFLWLVQFQAIVYIYKQCIGCRDLT